METTKAEHTSKCHVVVVPYPGRGHVNSMMNLCKLLCSKSTDILITFVVTEEWFGFIGWDNKPANVRFRTIPNVIPSEHVRAKDFPGFVAAVLTKMEAPFEELLDRLESPVTVIIADTYMSWTVEVGKRRNIPVAFLWTMSASVLSVFYHFNLLVENHHFPADLSEQGNELVDYIPGLTHTRLADLPTIFYGNGRQTLQLALDCVSLVPKAQYLLFTSVYELELQVIDAFKAKLPFPVYPIGPSIPYLDLKENSSESSSPGNPDYLQWLDSQPQGSVLYVSFGSFLSVSAAQMDEIVAGVHDSGVRYLWVSRGDSSRFKDCCGGRGRVIPWSDQLRVLCHSSVGGFWTHCGWNSTLEAAYAGVPVLTFPIFWDQVPNSKQIVEDWKIGWRVKKDKVGEHLMTREEIAELVRKFMDFDSNEGKEMRTWAGKLRETCQLGIAKGGSSDINLDSFIQNISEGHTH
ncbi:UDP-glycosyltransferase 87A2-like [Herrania umbratica]|uniref:UDP-glycosyltransferase 87A2-like n=1 Tax=Herrania umbratica TaxID=108875 RepID=A0A6J0ZWE0_9ROSI|nr:UDP-glycosyltransferase 87A2-like [Herrania umbratica]XP_021279011.1 UDP-glycosyltransferase 87A2-like [Herrania umbratica]XP_021279012.1 UDP-glycosyltransferase 87A2-like [Herrania umbratica]